MGWCQGLGASFWSFSALASFSPLVIMNFIRVWTLFYSWTPVCNSYLIMVCLNFGFRYSYLLATPSQLRHMNWSLGFLKAKVWLVNPNSMYLFVLPRVVHMPYILIHISLCCICAWFVKSRGSFVPRMLCICIQMHILNMHTSRGSSIYILQTLFLS